MAIVSSDVRVAVEKLVRDLAAGRFQEICGDGRGGRLTTEELERAVREYGRKLVPLPPEAWPLVRVYGGGDSSSLDVPLWTREEGRSDLTLSLSVERADGRIRVAIDDLHVL